MYSIQGQQRPANTDKSDTSKNLIIDICHQSVNGFTQCYQCRNPARIKSTYVALNVQISYTFYTTVQIFKHNSNNMLSSRYNGQTYCVFYVDASLPPPSRSSLRWGSYHCPALPPLPPPPHLHHQLAHVNFLAHPGPLYSLLLLHLSTKCQVSDPHAKKLHHRSQIQNLTSPISPSSSINLWVFLGLRSFSSNSSSDSSASLSIKSDMIAVSREKSKLPLDTPASYKKTPKNLSTHFNKLFDTQL